MEAHAYECYLAARINTYLEINLCRTHCGGSYGTVLISYALLAACGLLSFI